MKPEDVPADLIRDAQAAWQCAPQKRDGQPLRMRHALAAILPAHEALIRAKVAEQIEQELLTSAWDPGGMARAANIARGGPS